jgi:ankyrin repeat domain-containing protein 50
MYPLTCIYLTNLYIPDMERQEDQDILNWISTVENGIYHEEVSAGRLRDSGLWLLKQDEYMNWRNSPTSSTLWLHGRSRLFKSVSFTECTNAIASPSRYRQDHTRVSSLLT